MNFKALNGIPHYMQSQAFAEYMAHLGWQTEILGPKKHQTFLYTKKLPIIGIMAKAPKVTYPFPLDKIEAIVHKKPHALVRLEPNMYLPTTVAKAADFVAEMQSQGYGHTWLGCELKTIRVDLTPSPEAIFANIKRENTRRNIRVAQKHKLIARESDDLTGFYQLHAATAKRKKFYCPPYTEIEAMWQSFRKIDSAKLLHVYATSGELVAGIFLILYNKVAYYRYVGSTDSAQSLRAPSLAVFEAFLLAKRAGCDWFDFYGVNDERGPTKQWQGFSHFKEGFSSNTLRFVKPIAKYSPPFGPIIKLFDRIL